MTNQEEFYLSFCCLSSSRFFWGSFFDTISLLGGDFMRYRKIAVVLSFIIFFVFPYYSFSADGGTKGLQVVEGVIAASVVDRTPQDVSDSFPATVSKLYAFTKIAGAKGDTTIKHLWFYGDRLMAEVKLPVRSSNWRTYSSKRILPSWTGEWRVDIVTEDGALLKSIGFHIR